MLESPLLSPACPRQHRTPLALSQGLPLPGDRVRELLGSLQTLSSTLSSLPGHLGLAQHEL